MTRYFLLLAALASCPACGTTDLLPEAQAAPEDTSDMGRTDLFIPLAKGIRTDIAADLLPVGSNLEIENMQFDLTGSLVKRFGNINQSITVQPGGGTLPETWQLATHKGARVSLSQPGASPLGIYSPGDNAWNIAVSDRRGPITTALNKVKQGGNNPRIAAGAGFYYLLYADLVTGGLMHFDMVDATTNHVAVSQTFLASGNVGAYDVLFCNGFAVAVTQEAGVGIVFRRMTPSTKTFTTTTFAATFASSAFDAIVANATTISVAYANNVGQAAGVDFVPSTLTTTGFAIKDATAANISLDLGHTAWVIDLGGSGKIALVTASTTQGVRTQWDLSSGATRTATTTFATDAAITAIAQMTAFTTASSAAGTFTVLTTRATAAPWTNNVTRWGGAIGGASQPASVLYRSLSLLSKPYSSNNNGVVEYFCLFSFPSIVTGDGNSYVMRIPVNAIGSQPTLAAPQAQFAIGSSGNVDQFGNQNQGLTSVLSTGQNYISAISYLNRIGIQADSFYSSTVLGIELVTISHLQPTAVPTTGAPIEAADSLFVPGGSIGQYDGANYAEMGFAYAPQAPVFTPATATGSLTTNSTYWYVLVYTYMDAQGRLWRSGTSVPASTPLAGTQNTVVVACPTLRVVGRSSIQIEIYRGAANSEALFQKLGQVPNDLTVDTVSFVDIFSDAQIAIGEELYTGENGNAILNNDTIPGGSFLWVYGNRLWFISADNPTELWFSNVISPGNGVRFNSQNVVRIADSHGAATGAASMEDKVVVAKNDAIYTFNGDGPDDAGNGQFSQPNIVALGIGSSNPRSIVSFKDGVFFESTAARPGIQMIDRGLSIAAGPGGNLMGAAVEKYAGEQIMSAILVPEQSQIRFYCLSGRVLVYDLLSKEWATFLLNAAASVTSAVANGGAVLMSTDSFAIWYEDNTGGVRNDAGATYGVRLASPWVSVSGIKGFERIIQLIGVGKTMGDHTLDVQMYKDFDDTTIVNEKTWAITVAAMPLWNWEWNRPRVARMSAEKLVLIESSAGAGFRVEGVSETLGLRSGLNRQPTTTRGP